MSCDDGGDDNDDDDDDDDDDGDDYDYDDDGRHFCHGLIEASLVNAYVSNNLK